MTVNVYGDSNTTYLCFEMTIGTLLTHPCSDVTVTTMIDNKLPNILFNTENLESLLYLFYVAVMFDSKSKMI